MGKGRASGNDVKIVARGNQNWNGIGPRICWKAPTYLCTVFIFCLFLWGKICYLLRDEFYGFFRHGYFLCLEIILEIFASWKFVSKFRHELGSNFFHEFLELKKFKSADFLGIEDVRNCREKTSEIFLHLYGIESWLSLPLKWVFEQQCE